MQNYIKNCLPLKTVCRKGIKKVPKNLLLQKIYRHYRRIYLLRNSFFKYLKIYKNIYTKLI